MDFWGFRHYPKLKYSISRCYIFSNGSVWFMDNLLCLCDAWKGRSYVNTNAFVSSIFNNGQFYLKVSEYPFKQNKNVLKNVTVLSYMYFYNISLNVLRPSFFNIYKLPFLSSPNIGKIRVKVGPKTNYFFLLYELLHQQNWSFSLICSQPRGKQNRAHDFLLFKYFLNNLLLTVFMQNTLSKLVELLP